MKKWMIIVLVGLGVLLTGCANMADEYDPAWQDEDPYTDENTDLKSPDPVTEDPVEQGGTVTSDSDAPALPNRKIIYEAAMHMAVLDPDQVYDDVMDTIGTYTAYVEGADITTSRYILTIRVLSSEFDALVEDLKTTGELVSFSKSREDITNTYSTFEARYDALEARHTRIVELINNATDLQMILDLEEERYEIESQLNAIGNTLSNYDSLVDYSTISLRIDEAVEEIVVLPRTEAPNVHVDEVTKNTITLEIFNHSDENVTLNVDLYQNGEFIEQYEESTFADSKVIVTFDGLKSNKEYTIKVTAFAAEHRVSLEETVYRTTEATYGNRTGDTFIASWNLLVLMFEGLGLIITALVPFAITGVILFIPARILYKKKIKNRLLKPHHQPVEPRE